MKVQSRSDHTTPHHLTAQHRRRGPLLDLLHLCLAGVASHAKRLPGHPAQTSTPTARGGRGPLPRRSPWRRGSARSAIAMHTAEMAVAALVLPRAAAEIIPHKRRQRPAAVEQAASASATCCRTSARSMAAMASLVGISHSTPLRPLAGGPNKLRADHPRWRQRDALPSGGPGV